MAALSLNEGKVLMTAQVRVYNPATGKEVLARALLDPGSQINLVTAKLVERLSLPTFKDTKATVIQQVEGNSDPVDTLSKFVIKHRTTETAHSHVQALVLNPSNWTVRLPVQLPSWIQERQADLADPELVNSHGQDLPFDILLDTAECIRLLDHCDYRVHNFAIQATPLGLIPCGGVPSNKTYVKVPKHWCLATQSSKPPIQNKFYKSRVFKMHPDFECDDIELTQDIARAYELDIIDLFGQQDDDQAALQNFLDETVKSFVRKDGRVYAKLPKFHGMSQPLAKNHKKVQAQLSSLEKRIMADADLAAAYGKAIQEWVDTGVLVPTTLEELNKFQYWAEMPYHPVFR